MHLTLETEIVYLPDNPGKTVFDKIVIELMARQAVCVV